MLSDIAIEFWEELVKIQGPMSCANPWHKHVVEPSKTSTTHVTSSGIRDLSSGAMSSDHLDGLGVKKDATMICKGDSLRYTISEIDNTDFVVHLSLVDSKKKKNKVVIVGFAEIFDKYEVAKDIVQDFLR